MMAEDFRRQVGSLIQTRDEATDTVTLSVENNDAFREITQRLRVLARATSEDKHLLVVGLKNLGRKVAVTGDGINDIEALEIADVGFAIGSGVSAAKQASSIILTDDDFEASLRSVMWGRNIYQNISRFLQFQMTVNISAVLTIALGIILFQESPLTSVQLLWINLIMDTFAALALASEPPFQSIINGPPLKEDSSLLLPQVWRQIIGISIYNFLVMCFVLFFGRMIGGLAPYTSQTPTVAVMPDNFDAANPDAAGKAYIASEAKLHHFTYIFNTFIFLQIFNMVNCRKIGRRDFNVFEDIFHNFYFLFVVALIIVVQIVMCQLFPGISHTVPMTKSEWGSCIVIGSTSLLISAILKLTPDSWIGKIPADRFVNEDTGVGSNKLLSTWDQANQASLKEEAQNEGDFTQVA